MAVTVAMRAQSAGDYRTANSGDWDDASKWEIFDGTTWSTATVSPSNTSGVITLRSSHIINLVVPVTIDQCIIEAGATLLQSANLTIANGSGTDLSVSGTWSRVGGSVTINTGANIAINNGGVYSHESSAVPVPLASWATNSTCRIAIMGGTSYPGGMNQIFGNVLFESNFSGTVNMTTSLDCNGNLTINNSAGGLRLSNAAATRTITVAGNFVMQNGVFTAKGGGLGSAAIFVAGNFIQSGGNFAIRTGAGGPSVMTVQGNFTQSGGTFNMSSSPVVGILNVQGNFSVTGGNFTESGAGYGEVNFTNNGGIQVFNSGGNILNDIRFTVNSLSTLHIPSGHTVGGSGIFTNNGTVTGTGTIGVNTTNVGKIIPGNSIGTLTITGSLSLDPSSEIIMEIQGGPPISDLLNVTGALNFAGKLTVNLIGMGSVMPMDLFTLFNCGTCAGTFSMINLPGMPSEWEVQYNATNFRIKYIGTTPFPIELLYFDAKADGRTALITWGTATEYNNDYMAVERSADGRAWQEIGRVSGAGTTTIPQHYRLVDEKPLPGNNYYRLRQVDFDGAFEYHKVVALYFDDIPSVKETPPRLFPNPVRDQLTVMLDSSAPLDRMIWLYDLQGHQVRTWLLPAGIVQTNINLTELPSAMYVLRVEGQSKAVVLKKE